MASRRELQTLLRRLQATLASNPIFSTKSMPLTSTHFGAAPSLLAFNVATGHTDQQFKHLHNVANSRRWTHTTPTSNYSTAEEPATSAAPDSNDGFNNSADDMQQEVLYTALTLVKELGWTRNALQTAASQLGLSPAIAGSFPRGAAHLVEAFNEECNKKLRDILSKRKEELEEMDIKGKLALGAQLRLEMVTEYLSSWPDALALQAHPSEVAYSLQNYGAISDIIWRAAGDRSADFSWYTKRAALSGVYVASELFLLTDKSDSYSDTWRFIKNRLSDIEGISHKIFG